MEGSSGSLSSDDPADSDTGSSEVICIYDRLRLEILSLAAFLVSSALPWTQFLFTDCAMSLYPCLGVVWCPVIFCLIGGEDCASDPEETSKMRSGSSFISPEVVAPLPALPSILTLVVGM